MLLDYHLLKGDGLQLCYTHIAEENRALVGMLLAGAGAAEAARTLGRHAVQRSLTPLCQSAPVAG